MTRSNQNVKNMEGMEKLVEQMRRERMQCYSKERYQHISYIICGRRGTYGLHGKRTEVIKRNEFNTRTI